MADHSRSVTCAISALDIAPDHVREILAETYGDLDQVRADLEAIRLQEIKRQPLRQHAEQEVRNLAIPHTL